MHDSHLTHVASEAGNGFLSLGGLNWARNRVLSASQAFAATLQPRLWLGLGWGEEWGRGAEFFHECVPPLN